MVNKVVCNRKICFGILSCLLLLLLLWTSSSQQESSDTDSEKTLNSILRVSRKTNSLRNDIVSISSQGKSTPHENVVILDCSTEDKDTKSSNFPCVIAKIANVTAPVCIYDPSQDLLLSATFKAGHFYEVPFVLGIQQTLRKDPRLQFIDLGANLGTYALAVAHIQRHVLAVEANVDTARRLRQSVYLGNISRYFTLLHNAVSDTHETISLGMDPRNKGDTYLLKSNNCTETDPRRCVSSPVKTITLDDLVPLLTTNRVVMKVDVQGVEIKVFNEATASKFFAAIQVPYIFLEWNFYQTQYWSDLTKRAQVDSWLKFFYSRNYTVHHQDSGALLGPDWNNWSYDVIFKKPYENLGLL